MCWNIFSRRPRDMVFYRGSYSVQGMYQMREGMKGKIR